MFLLFALTVAVAEVEYCFLGNNRFPRRPAPRILHEREIEIDLHIKSNDGSIDVNQFDDIKAKGTLSL